jgi:hypothetical protein
LFASRSVYVCEPQHLHSKVLIPLTFNAGANVQNSGQNPGFDFLLSCWNDDPALQIVIKKLLAKFPQWGFAIVDGVLMKWNG